MAYICHDTYVSNLKEICPLSKANMESFSSLDGFPVPNWLIRNQSYCHFNVATNQENHFYKVATCWMHRTHHRFPTKRRTSWLGLNLTIRIWNVHWRHTFTVSCNCTLMLHFCNIQSPWPLHPPSHFRDRNWFKLVYILEESNQQNSKPVWYSHQCHEGKRVMNICTVCTVISALK